MAVQVKLNPPHRQLLQNKSRYYSGFAMFIEYIKIILLDTRGKRLHKFSGYVISTALARHPYTRF
jgi:hypothetical protein